jgi:stress-induced-phosphoprotein 1
MPIASGSVSSNAGAGKALDALEVARENDEAAGSKSVREIQDIALKIQSAISAQRATEAEQETLERAMRDLEVAVRLQVTLKLNAGCADIVGWGQEIMTDPVMQSILQQAQTNPQALQDHMKNPTVRTKIVKLINAGIIKTR